MPELTLKEEALARELSAPLYIAWQVTNECDLGCVHCIEESGPGRAFPDEMSKEQVFSVLEQIADNEVPYVSFSGGEPFLHPDFFGMCEFLGKRNVSLKIETNGRAVTPEAALRLERAGVRAVQVSIDGATSSTFERMRPRGRIEEAISACRALVSAGINLEVNFVPSRFNIHEVGKAVDLACELGAFSFYTGPMIRVGNAAKAWHVLEPTKEQYGKYFRTLKKKASQYEGRMRVYYHSQGIVNELLYRLKHPAALFIILPNGRVKLINSLPFVCGDLRTQKLSEVWQNFKRAWKNPRVGEFIRGIADDPIQLAKLHNWIDV